MNDTFNQFENLSAENECDRMAQMTPEEMEEYFEDCGDSHDMSDDAAWLASAGMGTDEDYAPDAHLESAYEERTDLGDNF